MWPQVLEVGVREVLHKNKQLGSWDTTIYYIKNAYYIKKLIY